MLKRYALMTAVTTALVIPTSSAFAIQPPTPKTNGVLPEETCFAAYPAPIQPLLCGRGTDGPGAG